jgi:hypothetical protein
VGRVDRVCAGDRGRYRSNDFLKLAKPVLMQIFHQQRQTNLANLKDVLEAQG